MLPYPEPIQHPGNRALFRALELSVLSTLVGVPLHVHAEGLRGTGKTTIIRSLRRRLPRIQRVKGCLYNCLPWAPHCPEHRGLSPEELKAVGTEWVPMPFREISHSAKVGTVAGSIDLSRLTDALHPEAALLPGTLPQANRGIVFVDEINRLADTAPELADILLDVMGTKPGRLQVEETGLPCVDIPVCVSVWAASNPDEEPGPLEDIRKQLSDRFDFVIEMERPSAVATVRDILRAAEERQLALAVSPPWRREDVPASGPTSSLVGEWQRATQAVLRAVFPPHLEEFVASLYVDFGLESLRAVEAIHHGARVNCVLEGREVVSLADVAAVAPGALQHRLDVSTFARVMDHLNQKLRGTEGAEVAGLTRTEAVPPRQEADGAELDSAAPAANRAACPLGGAAQAADASGPGGGGSGGPDGRPVPGPLSLPAAGEAPAAQGSGADSPPPASFWSRLGLRPRSSGAATRGSASSRSGTGAENTAEQGRGPGGGSGGSTPDRRGAGVAPGSDGPPVAPPHRARPLSDILRDIELRVPEWPGPRLP
ncbi:MAG: hypothetical protein K6U08_05490 [Firmicutes bacterium]|nr:hypothetical protein [Bacillota bacterium]